MSSVTTLTHGSRHSRTYSIFVLLLISWLIIWRLIPSSVQIIGCILLSPLRCWILGCRRVIIILIIILHQSCIFFCFLSFGSFLSFLLFCSSFLSQSFKPCFFSLLLQSVGIWWFVLEHILFVQNGMAEFIFHHCFVQEASNTLLDEWHAQDLVHIRSSIGVYF